MRSWVVEVFFDEDHPVPTPREAAEALGCSSVRAMVRMEIDAVTAWEAARRASIAVVGAFPSSVTEELAVRL